MFQNAQIYDAKCITPKLKHITLLLGNINVNVIAHSNEKFINLTFGHLKFIDSFQFMSSSLENLAEGLQIENDNQEIRYQNFKNMRKYFPRKYDLLCQKGHYPYEWIDNNDKFNYKGLPPIENFYSSLKMEGITPKEYKHA